MGARVGGDRFVLLCRTEELELSRFNRLGAELMRRLHLKYALHICAAAFMKIDDPTLPVAELCDRAQIAQETVSGRSDKSVALYGEELRRSLLWEQEVATGMYEALGRASFRCISSRFSACRPTRRCRRRRWCAGTTQAWADSPDQFISILKKTALLTGWTSMYGSGYFNIWRS